jgi:tetratricopeptide (TPR) repeat protein
VSLPTPAVVSVVTTVEAASGAVPTDEPPQLDMAPASTPTAPPTSAAPTSPPDLPASMGSVGLVHEYQTWNNCGPATISMALSYFGLTDGQAVAARFLKPDPDDKNVGPEELAEYARLRGLQAVVRVNGDVNRLRALLAVGMPVIVETWFVPEPGDEMGHYRVLTGFSEGEGAFTAHDSYNGPGVSLTTDELDRLWRVFNRVYVPVYRADQAEAVAAVLGGDTDDGVMFARAAVKAHGEIQAGEDAFAWFNLGSSMLGMGDAEAAVAAFDRARLLGLPWRMLWYQFGPFEAYAAVGRWDDVMALADANLRNAPNLEESHYWRGRALAAKGDEDGARQAWRRALELNPNLTPAKTALESTETP